MEQKLCKIVLLDLPQPKLTINLYAVNMDSSDTIRNGKLSDVEQIDVRRFP